MPYYETMRNQAFPMTFQRSPEECGPACLKMIVDFYEKEVGMEPICILSNMTKEKGTSLLGLTDAAEIIGFDTISVEATYDKILADATFPAIIHWQEVHFAVLYKMTDRFVWIADPDQGNIIFSRKEFCHSWYAADSNEGIIMMLLEKEEED